LEFDVQEKERDEGVALRFPMARFVWIICCAALVLACHGSCTTGEAFSATGEALLREAREPAVVEWLQRVRRTLHEYPELKWEEERTSALIRRELERIGVAYEYPVAKHGVVARIGSGGPVVALRADMDALPIQVRFRSAFHSPL
jgi:hypothetical protein